MLEMHPTKMVGADMYIQAMRQDERDAKEPESSSTFIVFGVKALLWQKDSR